MRNSNKKIANIFIHVSLNLFCAMAKNNSKAYTQFVAFDSDDAKKLMAEKKAMEFPNFTTATGKCKLHRLIKWEQTTYRERDMEIPVVQCDCGRQQKQIELAKFFGKEKAFVVDRENGSFKKGAKYEVNALVKWQPELQGRTSARNEAVMAAIQEGQEINLISLWGHYDEKDARSFMLTCIVEGMNKI